MVNNVRKKARIQFLKKEIQVKNFIIKELLVVITNHKIKLPKNFMSKINELYGEEQNG